MNRAWVIDDVGKEACLMISQSPRNIELCFSKTFSQRVISRAFELLAALLENGVVPEINWMVVFELSDKFAVQFQTIVLHYLNTAGIYAKPITTILSTYLQTIGAVNSPQQRNLLELLEQRVLSAKMNKNARMAIFKHQTLKHLASVFQKTQDEQLRNEFF